MPEEEVIKKEEVEIKKEKKPKKKPEPQLELVMQDPMGNKLYRVKEGTGYRYTAFNKSNVPLSEDAVKQMISGAGLAPQSFQQTPFQLKRSPLTMQQPEYQVEIYKAKMPFISFMPNRFRPSSGLSMQIESIDLDKLEHEEYQKRVARYQRRKMKKRM